MSGKINIRFIWQDGIKVAGCRGAGKNMENQKYVRVLEEAAADRKI